MKIPIIIHESRFEIGEYHLKKIKEAVKDGPVRAQIETIVPESRQQRKYLHGSLIPLWIALDGNDYKNQEINDFYFEQMKREFSPEAIKIHGKIQIRGKSSRGAKALNTLTEKLIDMMVEEYGLKYDSEVLKPANFEKFRDELYMTGTWDSYLDYAKEMKWW